MQGLDLDVLANSESLAMRRSLGHLGAVLATNDGKGISLEQLRVAACVVMVAADMVNFYL